MRLTLLRLTPWVCAGALKDLPKDISDSDFCYAVLNKVSRSFALVIQQLPEVLKDCICIFYLVLRGLDSVEDDQDVRARGGRLSCPTAMCSLSH